MAQPPLHTNNRTIRTGLIDGVKRRWVVAGGGLVGLVAIVAIAPALFSPAAPAAQIAATPSVIIVRSSLGQPTKGLRQVTAPLATSAPISTPAPPSALLEARIVRVVDGETLEVEVDGRTVLVKLAGVSAPGVSPTMCFGREAADYTRAMVISWGKRVWLESDVSDDDGAGRLLRYVWLEIQGGKRMLNEAMLESGFAKAEVSQSDTRYKDRFLTVEHDARVAKRGLWGVCGGMGTILPTQEPATLPTAVILPPTQQMVTPTSSPTVEASPTARRTSTRIPSPSLSPPASSPSPTATRTRVAPSPTTKPASPTAVPTRTPTRTVKPVVPSAAPTTPRLPTTIPTIAPTQPAPSPTSLPQQTPEPQPTTTSLPTVPIELPQPTATTISGLRYDPNGPDRDCPDFATWEEAQAFFIAAGGPERDPHRLDGDNDGIACEDLRK